VFSNLVNPKISLKLPLSPSLSIDYKPLSSNIHN